MLFKRAKFIGIVTTMLTIQLGWAQNVIPLDTMHWELSGKASYVFETYKGKDAIYLKGGTIALKDTKFKNGTIEFDLFLKEVHSFPGIYFRVADNNAEQFYLRTHLSGKPDANQAAPITGGISPWQLYFGPKYSFPYVYNYDDWTHVKLVVNEGRAQVFLDHVIVPNHSWELFHAPMEGKVILQAGSSVGMHIADVMIDNSSDEIIDFKTNHRKPIEGVVESWEVSDMFEKKLLDDPSDIQDVIESRNWERKITVEEGTAANISRVQVLNNGELGETVFARINIHSDKEQIKLFRFGYSDEVIAILNEKPIYQGTNKWRSRDYRYLGTVGLFDAVYLHLNKGDNTLLMAVSENFGGWLITGKFDDTTGIRTK